MDAVELVQLWLLLIKGKNVNASTDGKAYFSGCYELWKHIAT